MSTFLDKVIKNRSQIERLKHLKCFNFSDIQLQSKRSKSKQSDKEWETKLSSKLAKKNKEKLVGENWVKEDVNSFKPNKITMRDENIAHNLVGRVFDTKTFVDKTGTCKNLCNFLRWITWDQIPQVIGSMLRYTPKITTPKQASDHTEHLRRVKSISQTWHTQDGIKPVQQLLVDTYDIDPKIISIATTSFKKNPRIYINNIDLNVHKLDMENEGFLYFLKDAPKHLFWGEGKIRSTTKNLILDHKSEEEIIDFFKKKFKLPPSNKIWNKEKDLKTLAWSIPYLPPEYFMYDKRDKTALCTLFRSMIEGLRNKTLQFIKMLCKYHNMTSKEKKEAKKIRVQQFTDRMRSPEIQSLFLTGVKKEVICDQIYNELALKFEDQILGSAIYCAKEKLKRKEKDRSIKNSRKEKILRNDQWMHDDDYGQVELQNNTWSETTSSFLGRFSYLADYVLPICSYLSVIIIIPILNLFSIQYVFVKTKDAIQREYEIAKNRWIDMLNAPLVWAAKSENKLLMIQVNSVIQIINLTYHNKRDEIYGHAINLGITNWEMLKDFISLTYSHFDPNTRVSYNIGGIQRRGNAMEYEQDYSAYVLGQPLAHRDDVELQSGMGEAFENFLKSASLSDWNSKTISEMNQKFLFVKNAASVTKSGLDFFKAVISIVARTLFGIDPFSPEFMSYMYRVEKCLDDISRFDQMTIKDKNQREKAREIWLIFKEIESIRRDPLYQTLPNYKSNFFILQSRKFESIYQASKAMNGMLTERMEPTSVMILGKPGSGKSASVKFLESCIVHMDYKEGLTTIPEILPEHVYTCNFNDKFWSGYAGQKFTEVDDIFTNENKEERAREAQEIINMVNTAAYPLNMASLEEKGCSYFDSEYVFMTTNLVKTSPKDCILQLGLTDNQAFSRRLHLILIRNEKISNNFFSEQTFLVDQCLEFPELEGKTMKLSSIAHLIKNIRKAKIDKLKHRAPTSSQLEGLLYPRAETEEGFRVLSASHLQAMQDAGITNFELQSRVDRSDSTTQIDPFELLYKDIKRGILEWYENVEWKHVMLMLFALLVSSTTLIWAYSYFTREKVEENQPEFFSTDSSYSKATSSGRLKKKPMSTSIIKVRNIRRDVHLQNGEDFPISNYDAAFPNVMSGTAMIATCWIENGKQVFNSAQCSHMKDGWFVTPTHFFLNNGPDCVYWIKWGDREYTLENLDETVEAEELDVTLFKIPKFCQLPKSLYPYLADKASDTPISPGTPMRLIVTRKSGDHEYKPVNKIGAVEKIVYSDAGQFFEFNSDVTYTANTTRGDSGSIIVVEGLQNRAKIVGMHVGIRTRKGNSLGLGTPLTKELVDRIIIGEKEEETLDCDQITTQCEVNSFPHEISGYVPLDEAFRRPTRHSIKPSVTYGWNGAPTCIPVRLTSFVKDDVVIDPYIIGVSKLHQTYTPEYKISEGAVDWLLSLYPQQEDRRLLEFSEVVKGTGEFFTSVNAGTSPGYPYCLKKTKGKSPWITVDQESCEIEWNDDIELIVSNMEEELLEGRNVEVLWADVLKTERREIAKVNAGKTRLFATCPLHYLLLMRKYFGKITEYLQSQCVEKPISVGINPHSMDWTIIHNRLSKMRGSVIAGDFENYDGRLPRFVGERYVLEFVNRWYDDGEVNAKVRSLLFEHIYNAMRLNGDIKYQVKDGNPSGNPWTSWYNSLGQLVMWYIVLTEEFKMDPTTWNIVVYGDDNVLTTMKTGLRVSDFQPHFKTYFGMNYTHFSKKIGADPYDTLDTIRYLGRSFTNQRGPWKSAPLELSVIVESTYWTNGSKVDFEVLMSTIESFVNEIFHFGRDFYRRFCGELLKWIKENLNDRTLISGLESRLLLPYDTIYNRNYGGVQSAEQYKNFA